MISDLDRSLGSQYFLNVTNERTCFPSCVCSVESSGLIDHLFGMHFWVKSYLCFCRVWMKLMEVANRFYQYRDNFEVT